MGLKSALKEGPDGDTFLMTSFGDSPELVPSLPSFITLEALERDQQPQQSLEPCEQLALHLSPPESTALQSEVTGNTHTHTRTQRFLFMPKLEGLLCSKLKTTNTFFPFHSKSLTGDYISFPPQISRLVLNISEA